MSRSTDLISDELSLFADMAHDALKDFDLPPRFTAMLVSSIAEGLHDDRSDLDLLVIDDEPLEYVRSQPSITWRKGRRVEVQFLSLAQLQSTAQLINGLPIHFSEARPPHAVEQRALDEYRTYYEIANGTVIFSNSSAGGVLEAFSNPSAARAAVHLNTILATSAFDEFLVLDRLGLTRHAFHAARTVLEFAAMIWAARNGQPKCRPKFINRLLQRAGMDEMRRLDVVSLLTSDAGCAKQAISLASELGLSFPSQGTPSFRLKNGWLIDQIGTDFIVHCDRCVVGFSDLNVDAGAAMLSLPSRYELPHDEASPRSLLSSLYRLGIVEATGPLGLRHAAAEASFGHHADYRINWSGMEGFRLITDDDASGPSTHVIPLPLKTVLDCARELWRSAYEFSHITEDAVGALRAGNWPRVDRCLRTLALGVGRAELASRGFSPLPQSRFIAERLRLSPQTVRMAELIETALANIDARDARSALEGYDYLRAVVRELPTTVLGSAVLAMQSNQASLSLRQCAATWTPLAIKYGVRFSHNMDDARSEELILHSGDKSVPRDKRYLRLNYSATANWARADDIEAELRAIIEAQTKAAEL